MLLTAGEKGYARTTVREVAERAGITQDRFHRRFGGKEACFARAYGEAAERLAGQLREACREEASWREGFRAAGRSLGQARRWSSASPPPSTAPARRRAPAPAPAR